MEKPKHSGRLHVPDHAIGVDSDDVGDPKVPPSPSLAHSALSKGAGLCMHLPDHAIRADYGDLLSAKLGPIIIG